MVLRFLLPLLALAGLAQAQVDSLWSRLYGPPDCSAFCNSAQRTADGGFILAGAAIFQDYSHLEDIWLVKTDGQGDTLWTRRYGYPNGFDFAKFILQTSDGGYFIIARSTSHEGFDGCEWILRTDDNGDTLWTRWFCRDSWIFLNRAIETDDGGFALVGNTPAGSPPQDAPFILKLSDTGDSLWMHSYIEDQPRTEFFDLVQTPDGGFALGGLTIPPGHGWCNFALMKADTLGRPSWMRHYGGPLNEKATGLTRTPEGGYALAGITSTWGMGDYDYWLVVTDSLGNSRFAQTYGNPSPDMLASFLMLPDGGLLLAGEGSPSYWHRQRFFIVRTNSLGDSLWSRMFGGEDIGVQCVAVMSTDDGGFALAGRIWPSNLEGISRIILLKTGSELAADPCSPALPRHLGLAVYPNPFNSSTRIFFSLPRIEKVHLTVFDLSGRRVRVLVDDILPVGEHQVPFDGSALPSGIYFARLEAQGMSQTRKMVLLK
ncbi:T9SS type A sorting domain-containing protein [bacterium]|nr:T9SS type A sorting domain-containing protein [bacterium]